MKISNNISKSKKPARKSERKAAYSVRIIPFIETVGVWQATANRAEDPVFSFKNCAVEEEGRETLPSLQKDCWAAMEAFFAIKTPEDACAVFNTYGPMQLALKGTEKLRRKAEAVSFSRVLARRDFWLAASRGEYGRAKDDSIDEKIRATMEAVYVAQPLQAELQVGPIRAKGDEEVPQISVCCLDLEEVLRVGVYLDKMNGLAWALCARERCGKPFRIGGHRNKIYCSSACAEVQAQTVYLAKKKREQEEMAAKAAKKSARRK